VVPHHPGGNLDSTISRKEGFGGGGLTTLRPKGGGNTRRGAVPQGWTCGKKSLRPDRKHSARPPGGTPLFANRLGRQWVIPSGSKKHTPRAENEGGKRWGSMRQTHPLWELDRKALHQKERAISGEARAREPSGKARKEELQKKTLCGT